MVLHSGFRDECGVFGVCDSEDAANLTYLGLYALQHRGQESAGIASLGPDGRIHVEREMGYVADVFTEERLSRLPGRCAMGHVRYSTSGASLLINAQPIVFAPEPALSPSTQPGATTRPAAETAPRAATQPAQAK